MKKIALVIVCFVLIAVAAWIYVSPSATSRQLSDKDVEEIVLLMQKKLPHKYDDRLSFTQISKSGRTIELGFTVNINMAQQAGDYRNQLERKVVGLVCSGAPIKQLPAAGYNMNARFEHLDGVLTFNINKESCQGGESSNNHSGLSTYKPE